MIVRQSLTGIIETNRFSFYIVKFENEHGYGWEWRIIGNRRNDLTHIKDSTSTFIIEL